MFVLFVLFMLYLLREILAADEVNVIRRDALIERENGICILGRVYYLASGLCVNLKEPVEADLIARLHDGTKRIGDSRLV